MKVSTKYKPNDIIDVVFPNPTVEMQVLGLAQGLVDGSALFWGQPGNGKTTCATLLPKALGASDADVIFLNCSSSTSIENIRSLAETTSLVPVWDGCGRHFVVLDEIDGLSKDAQKALKRLIEERESMATFYATTNHIQTLDPGLLDRFQKISMDQVGIQGLLSHANKVLASEGVSVGAVQLTAVCEQANGSLRRLNQNLDWLILKAKMSVKQTSSTATTPKKSA